MKRCPLCNATYEDTFKVCPIDGGTLHSGQTTAVSPAGSAGPASVGPPDPLLGRTIAGRFRIERKLGEGGMGAVYKAEHVKMGRPCAIKILNEGALNDPESLPRFMREAQMSSRIEHQHAVTIYDYGESDDGLVYLAMEYIEGETLTKVLDREGKFPLDRVCKVARQIADALDAAHAIGIVHRDLKPDNIMLANKGGGGDYVKVLDFGIAKMAESEDRRHDLTQAGLIIGTPYYMSPEQVAGEKLDKRSDIFSFALIVYEMLSGRLPFTGQNTQAIMVSRLTTSPALLRSMNPDVPAPVETAVMRALARDRDLRTPSAGVFATELEGAVSGAGQVVTSDNQTQVATRPNSRPETTPVNHPYPPPPQDATQLVASTPQMPMTPMVAQPPITPFVAAPPMQPPIGAQQTVPPTDRTPYSAVPGYAPMPSSAYGAAPAKKGGGAGLIIGLVVVFLLLAGGVGIAGFGYYNGWFGSHTTAGPGPTGPTGPSTPPTTGGPTTPPTNSPSADAKKIFLEGFDLQRAKKDEDAIAKYKEAIAKQPEYPEAYRNMGAAYVTLGRYSDALKALDTAERQFTDRDFEVSFNKGLAYLGLEKWDDSADAFRDADELRDDPDVHMYLGFALAYKGDNGGSRKEFQKYLATNPPKENRDFVEELLNGGELPPVSALLGSE